MDGWSIRCHCVGSRRTFRREHAAVYEAYRDMLRSSKPDGYAACCEVIAAMDLRADLAHIKPTRW